MFVALAQLLKNHFQKLKNLTEYTNEPASSFFIF